MEDYVSETLWRGTFAPTEYFIQHYTTQMPDIMVWVTIGYIVVIPSCTNCKQLQQHSLHKINCGDRGPPHSSTNSGPGISAG
ncbi:hypothetical protein TNCV_2163781 [Trichonephila clavipes]|nr:hypothetical protein TNCV_2163781 [Trichonephila clavipes]